MSLHTKKPVILKYSRPIKTGVSHKKVDVVGQILGGKGVDYRFLGKGRIKDNEVIPKTIHSYRMWFRFLKLALELEQQNATLIMRFAQTRKVKQSIPLQPEIVKKIKVKRSKYKGWDLDEVLTKSFDDWWQTHSHLFSDEICKELSAKYEHYEWGRDRISSDRRHLTLQIDTSLKLTDILNMVNKKIKEKRKANKGLVFAKQRKYSVNGSVHKNSLLNRYNALLLKLENTLSNEEILTHKDGYIRTEYRIVYNESGNEDFTRPIYGLLVGNENSIGAKQLLVNVCDGFFMKQEG